jgi:hypothetical protein
LAEEKKAQEKLRKENEQAQVDAEERRQAIADKVDKLRSKYREAQAELKKCQAELEKAQERAVKMPSVLTTTVPLKSAGVKANAKKKRSADEMSMEDKVLSTPGTTEDRPKRPLKKRGFDLSMVGGKSEFSITPFLNKTVNLDDPAAKQAGDDGTPSAAVQFRGAEDAAVPTPSETKPSTEEPAPEPSATKPAASSLVEKEKKPRGRPRKIPLTDSSASKKNLTARARKAPRIEPTMEKVTEEPDDDGSTQQEQENRSIICAGLAVKTTGASISMTTTTATTESAAAATVAAEPKKKKRKLLGANSTTLFDAEEDDEAEKVKAAAVKRPGAAAKIGLAGSAAAPAAATAAAAAAGGVKGTGKAAGRVGAVKNAFAKKEFSPLKRDRRGVAASFLA